MKIKLETSRATVYFIIFLTLVHHFPRNSISPNASRRSSASSQRSMLRNWKTSISMISRGNPLFSRTFPRLINTISLSLFCARWLVYPLSRKIVIRYFVRNDIFSIFSAEIILFSCKFHKTINSFSCKIWFHYYNAPSLHYGWLIPYLKTPKA